MVPEDPIFEAVRRAIMGAQGGPMIREGGQAASGQVTPRLPAKVRPKREFREKHPKKLRLHPDEPIGADVFGFDDKMKRCSDLEKSRKWYCHTHPYTVQLTGNQN